MKFPLAFFLLSTLIHLLPGQDLSPEQQKALDDFVHADVSKGSPGVALGVVHNGQIVYEQYAGLSDLEEVKPIDNTSRFNIASSGKQFTALCILQLISEGKLNLEDDIRQYLPSLFPQISTPISITQLLNHSSGIRDVYNLWSLQGIRWWKQTFNNADAMALLRKQQALNFPPGSEHMYSNSNYLILAEIIREVSGKSFPAYAKELFETLGMPHTAFEANHTAIENMAKPYFNFKSWTGYEWLSDLVGDGALFTTLQDQLNWEVILQKQKSEVFSAEILQMSQKTIPGTTIDQYGFGLEFGKFRGIDYTFHGGSTGAWKCSIVRFPEQNLAVVAMTNSGKSYPPSLTRQCAEELIGQELLSSDVFPTQPEELGPAVADTLLPGTYKADWGYFFRVVVRDGEWYLERFEREAIQLAKEAENLYHQEDDPAFKLAFSKDSLNRIQLTAYYPTHAPYSLYQIPTDWSTYDFTSLEARYLNKETGAEFKLSYKGQQNYHIHFGKEKMRAELFEPDVLITNGYRFDVVRDEAGIVSHILLFDNRLQMVRFDPVKP